MHIAYNPFADTVFEKFYAWHPQTIRISNGGRLLSDKFNSISIMSGRPYTFHTTKLEFN